MTPSYSVPKLTDYQLQGCTWVAPNGSVFLELPFTVAWYFQAQAGAIAQGVEQSAHSEFDFVIRSIGAIVDTPGTHATLVQLQWPDGRFLSNPGLPVYEFIGTGLRGWLLENPELIPKGAKFKLNVDNSANEDLANLAMFFEGVVRIPLVSQ